MPRQYNSLFRVQHRRNETATEELERVGPDIRIGGDGGTLYIFTPLTARGREWVREEVAIEHFQRMGESFVVEHRFAPGLAVSMRGAGLRVAS